MKFINIFVSVSIFSLYHCLPVHGQEEKKGTTNPKTQNFLRGFKKGQLKGVVDQKSRRNSKFRIEKPGVGDVEIEIKNPEKLKRIQQTGVPVVIDAVKEGQQLKVDDIRFVSVDSWLKGKNKLKLDEKSRLNKAFVALQKQTQAYVSAEESQTKSSERALQKSFLAAEEATVDAFDEDAENSPENEFLCQQLANLNSEKKAIYLREDNYLPEIYRRIFSNSRHAVAIVERGADLQGSGVIIGRNLILTCLHVVDLFDADQLEVWLDYERGVDGIHKKMRVFSVDKIVWKGEKEEGSNDDPLDFALLEIGKDREGKLLSELGIHSQAAISTANVRREDPIYVVGHPQGRPRMVHDNAFVLFPFRLRSEKDLIKLRMLTCGENMHKLPKEEIDEILKQIEDSYRKRVISPQKTIYENYSVKHGNPAIGADCDTFHGNSGSAAYHRKTNAVIGILYAGEKDQNQAYTAGWRRHEAILPIVKIVEQLDAKLPGWRAQYKPVFQ